jgi:hypothetical protein
VILHGQTDLAQIIRAAHARRRLTYTLYARQQQGEKHHDDGNYNHQLDGSETLTRTGKDKTRLERNDTHRGFLWRK